MSYILCISCIYIGEDFGEVSLDLHWEPLNILPNNRFIVPIINDDEPEYTEMFEVWVECVKNCYLPQTKYIITIMDDDGMNITHNVTMS